MPQTFIFSLFFCFSSPTEENKVLKRTHRGQNNTLIATVFSFFRNITWVSKCVANSVTVLHKLSYMLLKLRDEHTDGNREAHNLHYRMNCGQKALDSINFSLENLNSFFEKFKVLTFVLPFSPFFLLPQIYHKLCHKSTRL